MKPDKTKWKPLKRASHGMTLHEAMIQVPTMLGPGGEDGGGWRFAPWILWARRDLLDDLSKTTAEREAHALLGVRPCRVEALAPYYEQRMQMPYARRTREGERQDDLALARLACASRRARRKAWRLRVFDKRDTTRFHFWGSAKFRRKERRNSRSRRGEKP